MTRQQLELLRQLGMDKSAGAVGRAIGKVVTAPSSAIENLLIQFPLNVLLGRKGKGAFSRTRIRPRSWSHGKRRPGGLAGFAIRHPIITGAGVLMAPEIVRQKNPTPASVAYGALRRRVAPMAPQIPQEYRL